MRGPASEIPMVGWNLSASRRELTWVLVDSTTSRTFKKRAFVGGRRVIPKHLKRRPPARERVAQIGVAQTLASGNQATAAMAGRVRCRSSSKQPGAKQSLA